MDERFRDWLKDVSVENSQAELEARWKAADAFVGNMSMSGIPDLIRAALDIGPGDTPIRRSIADSLHESDSDSQARAADLEVSVLAAIGLRMLVEREPNTNILTNAAALSVRSASFNSRRFHHMPELRSEADEYLRDEAWRVRALKHSTVRASPMEETIAKKFPPLDAAIDTGELPNIKEPLGDVLASLNKAIGTLSTSAGDAVRRLGDALDAAREESNIFWWMFGAVSRDVETSFSDLPPTEAGFRAAKELSDLTATVPGPASAHGFLQWILKPSRRVGGHKTSIRAAVNDLSEETREVWNNQYPSEGLEDVTPVLVAIRISLLTDGPDEWLPVYMKSSITNPEENLTVLELAKQLYDEMLFVRATGL